MNDSQLKELLGAMDSALPATGLQADLADLVRRRAKSRARIRRFSGAAALLFACALAAVLLYPRRELPKFVHRGTIAPVVAAQLRSEINDLNSRAVLHEQVALRLEELESTAATQRKIGADPLIQLSADRAATAGILVAHANELEQSRSIPQAIAEYQRVVELFADTAPALVAQRRLRDIKTSSSIQPDNLYSGVISWHGDLS
jgi:hypothetical protein